MPLPEDPSPEPITVLSRGSEPFFYGGQAVVEGVLMRGPRSYAVAVRKRNSGEIVLDQGELTGGLYTGRLWKLPFVRGLALLAEQMHLGMRSLIWSAGVSAGDQDVNIGRGQIAVTMAIAVAASLLLFIGLPLLGAGFAVRHSGSAWFVVVEGLIRVGLVIGYLLLIGATADVRRVFQYHGAEHKTINAFESGWPLDVPHVRRASLLHPRCGTGFLVVVVVVSVLVFGLVALVHPNWPELILSRVIGVPVIAGLSYECIRFMARHRLNPVVAVLLIPVLATQRLTTREPQDDMLEVALAAFQAVRRAEGALA